MLKNMTGDIRAKFKDKTMDEFFRTAYFQLSRSIIKIGLIVILGVYVLFAMMSVSLDSKNFTTNEVIRNLLDMTVFFCVPVFILIAFLLLIRHLRKKGMPKCYKRLQKRYHNLEDNIRQLNEEAFMPETLVYTSDKYKTLMLPIITKNWIVTNLNYNYDIFKIENVVAVCDDSYDINSNGVRTTNGFTLFLLDNGELIQSTAIEDESFVISNYLKKLNPNIFITKNIKLETGAILNIHKNKQEIIEAYKARKAIN